MIDLNQYGKKKAYFSQTVDEHPRVESALGVVTVDNHNDFFVVLACVQNGLGEDGRDLAEAWAQEQGESRAREFKDVWRSCHQGQGYSLGTLYKMAKEQFGWTDGVQAPTMTQEQAEARQRSREESDRLYAKARADELDQAKAWTKAILAEAWEPSENPYLRKKLVEAGYGLKSVNADTVERIIERRIRSKGELLAVPCYRDFGPEPETLQLIDGHGGKSFLAGGGVGIWSTAPFPLPGTPAPLFLVGEGVATALSATKAVEDHGAIGVSAGSNGQLDKTVKALLSRYPDARVIVLADIKKDSGKPDPLAVEAAQTPGAWLAVPDFGAGWTKDKGTDFNDLHVVRGLEAVRASIEAAIQTTEAQAADQTSEAQAARALFPRRPFPWHVLPAALTASFKQLGRAVATSATPAPAFAFCFLAAAVGRKFCVNPKGSWKEPLIFWVAHILDSGEGKTPIMWEMAQTLVSMQLKAHEAAKREIEEFNILSTKEKKEAKPPQPARGYFVNGATLEGIHTEAMDHGTGGLVVMMSELSALLNSYGEYKSGGGSDREGWLCLHDGKTVRIARAGGSKFIHDARIQICGGVQPSIFGKQFKSKDGTYLSDGTIFRFLMFYEPPSGDELTNESWSDQNREVWDKTLTEAFAWAESEDTEPINCILDQGAQDRFLSWANNLRAERQLLPKPFRGFIPKTIGAAIRLAGAVHLAERFSAGRKPGRVMDLGTLEKGIALAEYYAGQALDAMALIESPQAEAPAEVSPRTRALALALDGLRTETHDGRLSIGVIKAAYNEHMTPAERMKNPRVFAGFIRTCGIETMSGVHDYRDARRVTCIRWSEKIEAFIKTSLHSANSLQNETGQGLGDGEMKNCVPPFSPEDHRDNGGAERMGRWSEPSLQAETKTQQGFGEKEAIGEIFSQSEKKRDLPAWAREEVNPDSFHGTKHIPDMVEI